MWSGYAGIDDDSSSSILRRAPRPALRCTDLKGACSTRFLDEDEAGSGFLTENEEADRAVHTSSAIHGDEVGSEESGRLRGSFQTCRYLGGLYQILRPSERHATTQPWPSARSRVVALHCRYGAVRFAHGGASLTWFATRDERRDAARFYNLGKKGAEPGQVVFHEFRLRFRRRMRELGIPGQHRRSVEEEVLPPWRVGPSHKRNPRKGKKKKTKGGKWAAGERKE